MTKGINKADLFEKIGWMFESKAVKGRPCVFLSHKREDKPACRKIAEYLSRAEIDYYLDELDDVLQGAAAAGNAILITDRIKNGIRESTHMLVLISEITYRSQWVPFEVGYGHAAILDRDLSGETVADSIKLSILTLKDLSEKSLPDFMQVGNIIRGTKTLNHYISLISNQLEKSLVNESKLFSNHSQSHPLDDVLNWQL